VNDDVQRPGRLVADGGGEVSPSPQEVQVKLSVIIPAFNERSTVGELLRRVCEVPVDKEVIVVDDGSVDGTDEVLAELGLRTDAVLKRPAPQGTVNELRLLVHASNRGKGAAVRDGIDASTGEIILIQDADLEYDPAEYPKLMQPIVDGKADVVYGSRFTGSPRRVLFFWHSVGNRFLTLLSNMFTNLNLTDMETCYKVFRAEVVKGMPLRSRRFDIEPEITAKIARRRARIYEVPISYAGRSYLEGKKIDWRDGLAAVWTILKYAVVDDLENTDAGYKTLRRVGSLHRYNAWMWEKVAPWIGQRVLEVGAGRGNMTRLLSSRDLVVATDVDPKYVRMLHGTFDNDAHVRVAAFDLGADEIPSEIGNGFDTVICLNVLEHVEDDVAALRRIHQVLTPGGNLILVVPALRALYGEIDRAIGHYRRYERDELHEKLSAAGFTIAHSAAFNVVGALGWWFNARVLRRTSVPGVQARVNDLLVPLLRVEKYLQPRRGLSLLAVGRRPD
jgi:glycosyltransferase involved in cell wall biosynthesis